VTTWASSNESNCCPFKNSSPPDPDSWFPRKYTMRPGMSTRRVRIAGSGHNELYRGCDETGDRTGSPDVLFRSALSTWTSSHHGGASMTVASSKRVGDRSLLPSFEYAVTPQAARAPMVWAKEHFGTPNRRSMVGADRGAAPVRTATFGNERVRAHQCRGLHRLLCDRRPAS
jgi:hypothetical protein